MIKKNSPLRAIKTFCLDCAGSAKDVTECTANEDACKKAGPDFHPCPLFPFRKGHGLARGKGMGRIGAPRMEKGLFKRLSEGEKA